MEKEKLTEYGRESLMAKLKTSLRFYNDEENRPVMYPIKEKMLGFPRWIVKSREELYGRIIELSQLLNIQLEIVVFGHGDEKKIKIKEVEDGN